MKGSFVDGVASALARRSDRRGFLSRSALAGTATVVAGRHFLLEPISAYAAICSCSGSSCDCSAACCDGYTEFCCTITGSNSCPPGTVAAGWWKADAPGLCGSAPRYYIDCNVAPGHNPCSCGCANGSCGNRKACCTSFRYGQCNQQLAIVGAIMCRVVTCTPPWLLDATCTTAVRTDNNTRYHDAACLTPPRAPARHPGLRAATWHLSNVRSSTVADTNLTYGDPGDIPIVGDWNGDGTTSVGVFRKGAWYLRNSPGSGGGEVSFSFGDPGDVPIVGRWVADDPKYYPGVIRGTTWYLRTSQSSGVADIVLTYGDPGDIAVVGDWDGDGRDGIGVFRKGSWYLRNTLASGGAEINLSFGAPDDLPVPGRWLGPDDRRSLPGVRRAGTWYLRNSLTSGVADVTHGYGDPSDIPLVGDWNGDGSDSFGVAR